MRRCFSSLCRRVCTELVRSGRHHSDVHLRSRPGPDSTLVAVNVTPRMTARSTPDHLCSTVFLSLVTLSSSVARTVCFARWIARSRNGGNPGITSRRTSPTAAVSPHLPSPPFRGGRQAWRAAGAPRVSATWCANIKSRLNHRGGPRQLPRVPRLKDIAVKVYGCASLGGSTSPDVVCVTPDSSIMLLLMRPSYVCACLSVNLKVVLSQGDVSRSLAQNAAVSAAPCDTATLHAAASTGLTACVRDLDARHGATSMTDLFA